MSATEKSLSADVVVVGGTPAGCAAAICARRAGRSVVLIEPTVALGGAITNGVAMIDTATLESLSGVIEEFRQRVQAHYASRGGDPVASSTSTIGVEPTVCARIWLEMLRDAGVETVLFKTVPIRVIKDGARITHLACERASNAQGDLAEQPGPQESVRGEVFIDATYEGDLAHLAGAPYRIGREALSPEEPHAGILFSNTYAYDRQPAGGYPPYSILPGSSGEADKAVMAFNCRVICRFYSDASPSAPHRIKSPPPNYDPANYVWNSNAFINGVAQFGSGAVPVPGGKFSLNHKNKGTDTAAPARALVLAEPRERAAVRKELIDRALGFLYFIQTQGQTPQIGLADDEFVDNHHIPYQIYVREGRRIVGLATVTESDVNPFLKGEHHRPPPKVDAIAIGDYPIDIKKCRDDTEPGREYPEGAFYNRALRAPFQLPYGCLVPVDLDNLLVPCALSCTHVAFAAIRLEGVWSQTGMAAGLAAALMLELGCSAASVPVPELQRRMIAAKGKLTFFADVDASHRHFDAIQWAALRDYVPEDWHWRFLPEQPLTWRDAVVATVKCLRIPISVTGAHFEEVEPWDPAFRFVETLYDLGSRTDLETFPAMKNPSCDKHAEFQRAEVRRRWMHIDLSKALSPDEVRAFLRTVASALHQYRRLGGTAPRLPAMVAPGGYLSRAEFCSWLRDVDASM